MSYAKPLSRSGEIMIVPRANFPVGQPATPIHGRNTECERVLMLPLLGPGNLSLFVIAAGRVSRRFAFRRPSGARTPFVLPERSQLSPSLSNCDRPVRVHADPREPVDRVKNPSISPYTPYRLAVNAFICPDEESISI